MRARPVNPLAGRTLTEFIVGFIGEGIDQILYFFLLNGNDNGIILQAPNKHPFFLELQPKMIHNRPKLIRPQVVFNQKVIANERPFDQAMVASQDMALFIQRDLYKVTVGDIFIKDGIKAAHPQVSGQLAQVVVADKARFDIYYRYHFSFRETIGLPDSGLAF